MKLDLVEPENPGPGDGRIFSSGSSARAIVVRARCGTEIIARIGAGALMLVVLVSLIAACATRDPWQDARIEREVKARLVAEKSPNLTRLGIVSRSSI